LFCTGVALPAVRAGAAFPAPAKTPAAAAAKAASPIAPGARERVRRIRVFIGLPFCVVDLSSARDTGERRLFPAPAQIPTATAAAFGAGITAADAGSSRA
jgi:hypothetical protein